MAFDPYQILGVGPAAGEAEIRSAYRRAVQLHHPDHNNGSTEAARRFEEVQEAYAQIRRLRSSPPRTAPSSSEASPTAEDPALEARLAALERELRHARQVRERAQRAAREAATAAPQGPGKASDEELGYVRTEDSFTKIFSDAVDELAARLEGAREHPAARRISSVIDELLERDKHRPAS